MGKGNLESAATSESWVGSDRRWGGVGIGKGACKGLELLDPRADEVPML